MGPRDTVSYVRISQDRAGDGLAVERQRGDIATLAAQRGLALGVEYSDTVSAAGHKRRPQFEQLLEDVEAGGIDTVIAWAFDRLARHPRDALRIIDTCRVNRTRLVFVTDADMDVSTPGGELVASVRASVARQEIAQKSERQRAQRKQEAEQGRTPPSRRAFGYTPRTAVVGERYPVSAIDETEGPLVAEAYRQILNGRAAGAVARWLREQGSTTPAGRPWSYHNLRTVLVNPRYKGVRGVRALLPGRAGENGQREEFHTEVADGQWPAIVTADVWEAAQTILRDPGRRTNHPVNEHGARYLLPFIARCGVCDQPVVTGSRVYTRSTGERVHHRLLRCPTLKHISRKAEPIEEYVEEVVLGAMSNPEARARLRRAVDPVGVDLGGLREQIATLRARRDEATTMWADGKLPTASLEVAHRRLDGQLAELNDQLAAAVMSDPMLELTSAEDPAGTWAGWPIEQKRRIVDGWLTVTVLPGESGRPSGHRFRRETVRVELRAR